MINQRRWGVAIDLSPAQSMASTRARAVDHLEELSCALLQSSGVLRGLLLDPGLSLPGSLRAELLSSPLLVWGTASELRRLQRDGPLALLVQAGARPPETFVAAGLHIIEIQPGVTVPEVLATFPAGSLVGQVPVAGRLRLALVGALPPSGSASAGPNLALLRALAPLAEVEVFTDALAGGGLAELGVVVRRPAELRRGLTAAGFDAIVYGLAGHADDLPTLLASRDRPGVVWFHEDNPAQVSAEAVCGARAVIVGSQGSAARLSLDQGPRGLPCPLTVIEPQDGHAAVRLLDLVLGLSAR